MSRVERFFERLVERPSARAVPDPPAAGPGPAAHRAGHGVRARRRRSSRASSLTSSRAPPSRRPRGADPGRRRSPAELASVRLTFARSHGYALRERPRVTLQPDPTLRPGRGRGRGLASRRPAMRRQASEPPTRERASSRSPSIRAPDVVIEVREPSRRPATVPVVRGADPDRARTRVRAVLRDSRVSRRHARLARPRRRARPDRPRLDERDARERPPRHRGRPRRGRPHPDRRDELAIEAATGGTGARP